jgi:adenosylcobinamide kinase/adenosylcobinamide-phosphate guanylyltransferase
MGAEALSLPAGRELVLGGQRSGKSRRGEALAAAWLAALPSHRAVLVATAHAHDEEMRSRIARHRADRAARVPALRTVEEPVALAEALRHHGAADTLLLVDCLTLWLANLRMPAPGAGAAADPADAPVRIADFLRALEEAPGPVVIVGNEIGLGVIPMGREVREFVDALGRLNQDVAALCERVTFMAAGLPLALKGGR